MSAPSRPHRTRRSRRRGGTNCLSWTAGRRRTACSFGSEVTRRSSEIGPLCLASIFQASDLLHANRTPDPLAKYPPLLSNSFSFSFFYSLGHLSARAHRTHTRFLCGVH